MLYHLIPNIDLDSKAEVQAMLGKIKSVDAPPFVYFRWDAEQTKYLRYPSAKQRAAC